MLIRKMLRDVWKNKVPFIAIFLMMFAGNFIFSGITCEYNGIRQSFHSFIEETNLADAWVTVNETAMDHTRNGFTDSDLRKLEQEDAVSQAEGRTLLNTVLKGDSDKSVDLYVLDGDNQISRMKVVSGQEYGTDRDGVWLDRDFAGKNGYHLHDRITLEAGGQSMEKEIVGLCCSPEYIYHTENGEMIPDHENKGFAFLNAQFAPGEMPLTWNQILLSGKGDLKKAAEDALGDSGITVLLQKDHPSYSMIEDEITQHKEIGLLFVAVFVFIAVLIAMTTVHRLLSSQRMQIGILKALGFRKRQLYLHYISHSTIVCLVGAAAGWCAGYVVLPKIFYPIMGEIYTLPELSPAMLSGSWLMPFVCALLCLGISAAICRNYLGEDAAKILYSNFSEKAGRQRLFPPFGGRLPFSAQWNVRDIFRNRLRSAMTIFGVVGCVALLFSSMGLYTSVKNMADWTFDKVQTYETKVTGNFADEDDKQELLDAMYGEELMQSAVDISYQDQEKTVSFTGLSSQDFIRLYDGDDNAVEIRDGIAVSRNTAKELGIRVGDRVKWRFSGSSQWYLSVVQSVIRTPMTQGITMMREDMEEEGIPFYATSIIGEKLQDGKLDSGSVSSVQQKKDVEKSLDTLLDASTMLSIVFLIMAVLLGSVILYNLGSLSYMERYRDMATLKVLGFHDKRIRRLMVQQNLWLAALGAAIGLPAGIGLLQVMISTVQMSVDMSAYAPLPVYAFSVSGTFLISWLINRALSRKVRGIDMVAALKINE